MNFITKNKGMLGGVIVVVLCGLLYFMYFSGGSAPALSSSSQTSPISQDLLAALQNLHTITLDNSIFSDQVFTSLTDFGVTIPPENVGRRNPFIPLTGLTPQTPSNLPAGAR